MQPSFGELQRTSSSILPRPKQAAARPKLPRLLLLLLLFRKSCCCS
jgi:hypothetical protein